ncbi:MAG: TetR/AcrR family transcriptional regulator [Parvibaculaceae bacterium]
MSTEIRDLIVDAALRLAAEKPWPEITLVAIAEAASVSLAELAQNVSGKPQILEIFARRMDSRLLASLASDPVEGDAHDRLFDIMLRRFELLAPHKAAIANIAKAPAAGPAEWLHLLASSLTTQGWMLAAADIRLSGLRGDAARLGLAKIAVDTLHIWLKDDDAGLARTMAALDRKLRDGEALMKRLETPIALCSGFARVFRSLREDRTSSKAQAHDTAD